MLALEPLADRSEPLGIGGQLSRTVAHSSVAPERQATRSLSSSSGRRPPRQRRAPHEREHRGTCRLRGCRPRRVRREIDATRRRCGRGLRTRHRPRQQHRRLPTQRQARNPRGHFRPSLRGQRQGAVLSHRPRIPAMVEAGGGVVINLGSWIARLAVPAGAVCGATKGALETLTRTWSAEFGAQGIRVNALSPRVVFEDPQRCSQGRDGHLASGQAGWSGRHHSGRRLSRQRRSSIRPRRPSSTLTGPKQRLCNVFMTSR